MRSRRRAREAALQALYQCDTLDDWSVEAVRLCFSSFGRMTSEDDGFDADQKVARIKELESENSKFSEALIFGVIEYFDFIDQQISSASTHWSIGRMARVDRNILRIAVFEIGFLSDIPVNVSINEAIEVAKCFGADDSPMFINGVLDNIAKVFSSQPHIAEQIKELQQRKVA